MTSDLLRISILIDTCALIMLVPFFVSLIIYWNFDNLIDSFMRDMAVAIAMAIILFTFEEIFTGIKRRCNK
jgi:hypothetical protein